MNIENKEVLVLDDGSTKDLKLLNGWDWALLLRKQPQFIDKADLELLDGWDWACLLEKQPQLKKYKTIQLLKQVIV